MWGRNHQGKPQNDTFAGIQASRRDVQLLELQTQTGDTNIHEKRSTTHEEMPLMWQNLHHMKFALIESVCKSVCDKYEMFFFSPGRAEIPEAKT